MGKKLDVQNRSKHARVDSIDLQSRIKLVRKWMFEKGIPISNSAVMDRLGPLSLTPVQVSTQIC